MILKDFIIVSLHEFINRPYKVLEKATQITPVLSLRFNYNELDTYQGTNA